MFLDRLQVDSISKLLHDELKEADETYQQHRLAQLRGTEYMPEAKSSLFAFEVNFVFDKNSLLLCTDLPW